MFDKENERSLEEARQAVHDFKNQIINLQSLYHQGDNNEADCMAGDFLTSLEIQSKNYIDELKNRVVSNIIFRNEKRCIEHSICFKKHVECGDISFLNLMDASAIFDNALDNAFEACVQIDEEEKRYIDFYMVDRGNFIIIEISNSKNNKIVVKNKILKSTKEDSSAHGMGFINIINAAERYGGDVIYQALEDSFKLSVRLMRHNKT